MRKFSKITTTIFTVIFVLSIAVSAVPSITINGEQTTDVSSTNKFDITLNEVPNGLSGYNITVSLINASLAEIISVEFPKWASINSNKTTPSDSVWIKAVDLNDQIQKGATNVVLATLNVRRDNPGNISFIITVGQMDDDNGSIINTNKVSSQTVSITPVATSTAVSVSTPKPKQTSTSTLVSTLASTPGDTPLQKEIPETQKKSPGFEIIIAMLGILAAIKFRKF